MGIVVLFLIMGNAGFISSTSGFGFSWGVRERLCSSLGPHSRGGGITPLAGPSFSEARGLTDAIAEGRGVLGEIIFAFG